MNFRSFSKYIILLFFLGAAIPVKAQIAFGGLADFEIRKGGSDSSPYVNQTPNDKWSVYTPYLRLFANADISENWYISSALQADYYSGSLSSPFFSVLNLNWMPLDNSDFTATMGRFVTPYGAYSSRVLSVDNPFVHLPLSHTSGLPVSQQAGILPDDVYYDEGINGLTMIYQRMYSQGILIQHQTGESGWFRYSLAATLAPASGYFETANYNIPAFTGRFTLQPAIWAQLSFSFSHGSFMQQDTVDSYFPDNDLSSFRQTLLGSDLMISYHYYSFLIEYNRARWKAPYIDDENDPTENPLEAAVNHISAEAVVNFPFFVGGYAGVRLEKLISGDLSSDMGAYGSNSTWTYDRSRIELLAGYKLHRNVKMKISWLHSTDSGPDLDDNVFAAQWSVAF